MTRLILTLLLLLALGATTTVAVAWLLAAATYPPLATGGIFRYDNALGPDRGHLHEWDLEVYTGPGKLAVVASPPYPHSQELPAPRLPSWFPDLPPPSHDRDLILHDARGWPFLSLRCQWRDPDTGFAAKGDLVTGGIEAAGYDPTWTYAFLRPLGSSSPYVSTSYTDMDNRRALPSVPIWPGLILSTLFWSAAWTVPLTAARLPGVLIRARRRRRGRCPRCGYDTRALPADTCPECGASRRDHPPIPSRSQLVTAAAALSLLITSLTAFAWWQNTAIPSPHAIHIAARDGDLPRLKRLLARGIDPSMLVPEGSKNYHGYSGTTPLMWAAAHGQTAAITLLLDAGARLAERDGSTALAWAVARDQPEAVRILAQRMLAAGINPNLTSRNVSPPLNIAATLADPTCLQILLDAGVDPNVGDPPLASAAGAGRIDNLRILLAAGASLDYGAEAVLIVAAELGQLEAIRYLSNAGIKVPSDPRLLQAAVSTGNLEVTTFLLDRFEDPGAALSFGHASYSPIRTALERADTDMCRLLIDRGADPHELDEYGSSLLIHVNWNRANPEFTAYLFTILGLDPNHPDNSGRTPLAYAVLRADAAAVRHLLAAGADPLHKDNFGIDALTEAARAVNTTTIPPSDRSQHKAILTLLEAAVATRK